jgi:crotonobetainyl-CoA:carnitine CoA-transferase CaiB-like acyl-CoA transferase
MKVQKIKMSNNSLEGFTVLDLTHRLPGPLAGKIFTDLGAKVIKIEDHTFQDPFINGPFQNMDSSFETWYQQINENKKVIRLDFKEGLEKLKPYCQKADIILMGLPPKLEAKLALEEMTHPHVIVKMGSSSKESKSMHDLNIMAELGYLNIHVDSFKDDVIPPPFFPFAGVLFSHHIVNKSVAALLKAYKHNEKQRIECYLEDATKQSLDPLYIDNQKSFLHNGRYPCYNIYRTKDGYVALAALEEKFWVRICDLFNLELTLNDRFQDKNDSIKQELSQLFKQYSNQEISKITNGHDLCLTLF